jgi:GMP synthase (glutamine-hydrolysing)
MLNLIAVRHVPFEGLGHIAQALSSAAISISIKELGEPVPAAELDRAAALVLMGGPMSANDDQPWVRDELRLIERSIASQKPVLGVCLGAQLIAKALGARVYRNAVKEIGWGSVSWTEHAAGDALFHGLRSPQTVFQWHSETFDLPAGAIWLAASQACRHQAFRYADSAYGLQFHLEVTPAMISDWCRQDANCGDVREVTEPIDAAAHQESQAELAATVFGRWAALVANLARKL